MRNLCVCFLIVIFLAGLSSAALAQERGTAADAKVLVKKAVTYMKEVGKEKAIAEFNNPKSKFFYKDLVIWCVDVNGVVLVHPTNSLHGKNFMTMKDADGKTFIKEEIEIAKAKGSGTVDYRWTNLTTKKIEKKRAFFELVGDVVVNCGYFI
jgi:cytochrome c